MSSLVGLGQSALSNAPAIIANISVLAIFGAMVAAGVMRGMKEYREFIKPSSSATNSPSAQISAATILENVTLSEWTRSNKLVCEQLSKLIECMNKDREERVETRAETVKVGHAIGRLHDEIEELRRDLSHASVRKRGGS